jgi:hypothetical protein
VTYTVTAEDETPQEWTVTVTVADQDEPSVVKPMTYGGKILRSVGGNILVK